MSDTTTIEGTIAALYAAVGFDPDGEPQWEQLRALFVDGARLIPPQVGEPPALKVTDFDDWMRESRAFLAGPGREIGARGFRERELASRVERFGSLAHVFSSYGSYFADEEEPFARGINSIQLVRRDGRWLLLSIAWEVERPELPLPGEYQG